MSIHTDPQWLWRLAFAAWSVFVGSAGCDGYSGGRAPTATQHVLRVQASDAGSGTVIAPDASPQLACTITAGALSGTCAVAYPSTSTVQLVATPNGASTFAGWSGACTGSGDCVVDMTEERTVNASFAPPANRRSQIRQRWKHITFDTDRDGNRESYVMDVRSSLRKMTVALDNSFPAFTIGGSERRPVVGRRVAFASRR
jgi:hypothetical protein